MMHPMGPKFISLSLSGSLAAFPAQRASMLHILNNTGADVTLARSGVESATFLLKNGQAWSVRSITDASQVKASGSGTLFAEAE